jgi:hypothetical protein
MKKMIIPLLLLFFTAFACKEEIYSNIPNAPVSYRLSLNLQDFSLNAGTGAYLCITQKRFETDRLGYGGLLIVNDGIGYELVNLHAYDLACPVEANRSILIVPENTSQTGTPTAITAKCPHCGAVYNIIDGCGTRLQLPRSPRQSDSTYYYSLRTYRVIKSGNNGEYQVTN